MSKEIDENLEWFRLISQKEEYLRLKELLRNQHSEIMDELTQVQVQEDYQKLQRVMARMSDIGTDMQVLNWKISNIDSQLSRLAEE